MGKVRFGIIGTGFIAGQIASAIERSENADLVAVSSRSRDNAEAFVMDRPGVAAVQGAETLFARDDIDAVFIAPPTVNKEALALEAVRQGKHILVDKPFVDAASVSRMTEATMTKGLVFMDGTHFVHHPRTHIIRANAEEQLGVPQSLYSAFYFPFSERDNIRFDPDQEPTGALGDLAWYSMRAILEYLNPQGELSVVSAIAVRDAPKNAVMRIAGILGFESGETASFDCGYTVGAIVMDLSILGSKGMITMDDFVLDWQRSIAFEDSTIKPGYTYRTGLGNRSAFAFIETPTNVAQEVSMIDDFADLVAKGDAESRQQWAKASLRTQHLLDAVWCKVDAG